MTKYWHIHTIPHTISLLKQLIVLCIVVFISAQPMVKVLFDLAETNYELCETLEDDDAEEKEKLKEKLKEKDGKEDQFYSLDFITYKQFGAYQLLNRRMCNHSKTYNYFLEYNLEVPSPPPQQA